MSAGGGMSPYASWQVGDKIVCIDDELHDRYMRPGWVSFGDLDGLTAGRVYTIRRIGVDPGALMCVWLVEIIRPPLFSGDPETGYAVQRFRPVQTRKTSIAIFERMLTPKREHVDA